MSCSEYTSSRSANYRDIHKTTLLWLIAVIFPTTAHAELFSATAKLPLLLYTQKAVIDKLDQLIDKEHELFATLTKLRDTFQREQDIASPNALNYISHPINAFMTIKRLTVDVYPAIEKLEMFYTIKSTGSLQWPTDEDLVGASKALMRLQETYQLGTSDMAKGKLGEIKYSSPMSSGDCFWLARVLYNIGEHNSSIIWFEETLKKMELEDSLNTKARHYVFEFIANNYYKMGHLEESLNWLNEIIAEYPEGKGNLEKRKLWEDELLERKSSEKIISCKENITEIPYTVKQTQEKLVSDALCRREMKLPNDVTKRLKCRYDTQGLYPKLAPFKVEEVHLNPEILVYYDVMNQQEIEYIKKIALKEIIRAGKIHTDANGKVKFVPYEERVSQVGSFDDSDAAVARISRRAGRISRLTLEAAEPVHVGCYGMGGFFSSHYDMLEMSDVKLGGDTVFTGLGVAIPPRKGSAVTWRNVLPTAEIDLRMRHAGCPVLLGTKWTSLVHLQAAKGSNVAVIQD